MTIAQRIKISRLIPFLKKGDRILDLGCGNMWLTSYLNNIGFNVSGFSLSKPADIIGNIKTYNFNNIKYDVIIALEMIEHVDCFKEINKILKPKGLLIVSSPTPHWDWFCLIMEKLGIFQSRGDSPHINLFYLKDVPIFKKVIASTIFFMQFGVFQKES